MTTPRSLEARFREKTRRDPDTGCLLWTASTNSKGYGRIRIDGRNELAHRVAWRLADRTLTPGLELDHVRERCSSVLCVEVDHLEEVSHRENVIRGNAPSAIAHREQTCTQGHPMSPEHGRRGPSGTWRCNTCRRATRPSEAKPRPPAYCGGCGEGPLPQPTTGRPRIWCSKLCRERALRRQAESALDA